MKKPVIIVVLCLTMACGKQYYVSPNGYFYAKPSIKFKEGFILKDTLLLSPSAVYKQNMYGDEVWIKFFENGRLFYGSLSKIPRFPGEKTEGYTGYYQLEGNKIFAEVHYLRQRVWEYVFLEGAINSDTIRFYKDHNQGSRRNIEHFTSYPGFERYFLKHYERVYLMTPDW